MAGAGAAADGRGNKYAALDPTDGPELDAAVSRRRSSASERRSKERFVYGCAIFASLNAILLGYGEFFSRCRGRCATLGSESTSGNGAFLCVPVIGIVTCF